MNSTTPTWFESSGSSALLAQSPGSTSNWVTNGSVNSSSGSSSRSTWAPATSNAYCSLVCTNSTATATSATTAVVGILANQYANFYIGVILGIVQNVVNGFSYLFNKKAQQRLIKRGYGAGNSIRYVCDWMWWLAIVLLVTAESMNFVAYIFAPATVVAPLGALEIVACAIIARIFLKEHLNVFGQVGCVLTIIGTTLVVIFAPESDALDTVWKLWLAFLHPAWLVYLGIVIVVNIALISFLNPKWGKKIVFIPVTITASIGSVTVMAAKGLGVGLSELFKGDLFPLKFWFTYVILATGAVCIVLQIIYLNTAIAQYNINIVAPILYVEFTTLTITAGALLLDELNGLQYQAIIALALGFAVIVVSLFLITSFKDLRFGWRDWFFFMFKRKQTEAANTAAEAEGDHQQLGESSESTPDGNADATRSTNEQAAGEEATGSPDAGDSAEQTQESFEGDLATPKTNAGTDIPDGSAPSPVTPVAASTAASTSTSAAAEAAPERPADASAGGETDPKAPKTKKSLLDLFKRGKKDKRPVTAGAGETDKQSSGAGAEEPEKHTLQDLVKTQWYKITDLNAFGSRSKHKLLHSSKQNSQLDLSASASAPVTANLSAAGSGAVPTLTLNGVYDNAGADMSEQSGPHETHLQLGDGENDDAGGDQLAASSHSAKMLLGVQQLHEQRRSSGSSDGRLEGSVLISELPLRPPPLYTIGEVNGAFDLPTPRAKDNPFAPNAQTPRGSQSSGSTPRVELAMVGVPSTSSVAPVRSSAQDAPPVPSRSSDPSTPRAAAAAARSSATSPPVAAAAVEWPQAFTRVPSIAESSASYSLDALAADAFEDRSRERLPSDASSVVTVRAAVPYAGGAHVAANGYFQPLSPLVPVTAANGRVDFV